MMCAVHYQPTTARKKILQEQCNITLTRGGMYWKLRPPRTERFAEVLILHPEAPEIARGRSPRAISRAEGCKINAEANLEVRGGRNFQWIPTLVSVITFFFPRRGCFDFSFWPAHCVLQSSTFHYNPLQSSTVRQSPVQPNMVQFNTIWFCSFQHSPILSGAAQFITV